MASIMTSGAPKAQAHWLLSMLAALQQQDARYQVDPAGFARLDRVVARFFWDDRNARFYAKLVDNVPGSGCTGGDVVTGVDPWMQTVHEASAMIHGRVLEFLARLRSV